MYYRVVAQCTQSLKNLEACLDKAEQHAATKKFDVGVLMNSRLAPDMQAFIYQVQAGLPRSNELRRRALNQQPGAVSWRMPCAHCFSGTVESLA